MGKTIKEIPLANAYTKILINAGEATTYDQQQRLNEVEDFLNQSRPPFNKTIIQHSSEFTNRPDNVELAITFILDTTIGVTRKPIFGDIRDSEECHEYIRG